MRGPVLFDAIANHHRDLSLTSATCMILRAVHTTSGGCRANCHSAANKTIMYHVIMLRVKCARAILANKTFNRLSGATGVPRNLSARA